MDIDLLKTFIEVAQTRHFGKAADNLFLTQSAVSARIRLLEDTVGGPLFIRARNNIQLTPTGRKLLSHAETIVNLWHRTQQQISIGEDVELYIAVSGAPSLWDILLNDWLEALSRQPDISIQADVHGTQTQLRMLREGTLDIAFTFDAPWAAGLTVTEIAIIPLLLVANRPDIDSAKALSENYVLVDWGTTFASIHAQNFPNAPPPLLRVGQGRIAHSIINNRGGAAYLAAPSVEDDLAQGRLFRVSDAPVMERTAYAVFSGAAPRPLAVDRALSALEGLRDRRYPLLRS